MIKKILIAIGLLLLIASIITLSVSTEVIAGGTYLVFGVVCLILAIFIPK